MRAAAARICMSMRIDIWSDPACPWCWIGKHRFRQALENLGADAPATEVHWHPFQLDPDAGPQLVPLREALAAKFGGRARVEQMLAQTQAAGRAEGLPFDYGRGQVRANTFDAHRLMWLAAREGDADAVGEALFHAHFAEGRNVADPDVLAAAGAAGGLDEVRVRAMLGSDEGKAEVEAGLGQARALGITAVPTFVIDGRYAVQGAQSPDTFAQVLARVTADHAPPGAGADGAACGPDGCAV